MAQINHSRRAFFRRPSSLTAQVVKNETSVIGLIPQRPPWALNESLFIDKCTRCHKCVSACGEEIILIGDGGFPEIDFHRGECTFCKDCVVACEPEALMKQEDNNAFYFNITIDDSCLAKQKTHCQSCKDVCDLSAISMPWPTSIIQGSIQIPKLNLDDCTSCGACISTCPSQSISINAAASPNIISSTA